MAKGTLDEKIGALETLDDDTDALESDLEDVERSALDVQAYAIESKDMLSTAIPSKLLELLGTLSRARRELDAAKKLISNELETAYEELDEQG